MTTQPMLFEGEPVYRPELAQWHTPPRLAAKMASEHADMIRGACVLEPSAGGGALVRAALDVGADHVLAVEIDPAWCTRLRERFAQEIDEGRVEVIEHDFLDLGWFPRLPDVSLSNPPFDNGLDTLFLSALGDAAPENITLTNASALFGVDRFERVWSRAHVRQEHKLCRRPVFSGASGGGSKDVVVTWWGSEPRAVWRDPITWWPEAWS